MINGKSGFELKARGSEGLQIKVEQRVEGTREGEEKEMERVRKRRGGEQRGAERRGTVTNHCRSTSSSSSGPLFFLCEVLARGGLQLGFEI